MASTTDFELFGALVVCTTRYGLDKLVRQLVGIGNHDGTLARMAAQPEHLGMVGAAHNHNGAAHITKLRSGALGLGTWGHVASMTVSPRSRNVASTSGSTPWLRIITMPSCTSSGDAATCTPLASSSSTTLGL